MKTLTILKITTALNVIVSAAFSLMGIVKPELVSHSSGTQLAHIFAVYAAVRAIAILLVLVMNVINPAMNGIIAIASMAILIQLGDVFAGIAQSDIAKVAGPIVLAILSAVALYFHTKKSASV
ncbi:hypothetical protein QNI19_35315 [Cytophagaceae bacterium DM2B3-1]|uniref:Uncharacterized protein n=1 Tax=Xanthocytophaga flava TaxID=3048013 RepID=A0ABT7CWW2_9BACT|nr:hypothetical protein [Xanthocytophaga flavus]MDJ1498259.1 hypothetical protein [Xanthocytophaga flavus]